MSQKEKNQKITCNICTSKNIIKKGLKHNKLQTIQRYLCKDCNHIFTQQQTKNKTYPVKTILNTISSYNLGYTLKQIETKLNIPSSTISEWLKQHKSICIYSKLRKKAAKLYTPKNIIQKQTLNHIQPYDFKYHKAKLTLLTNKNKKFQTLTTYLKKVNKKDFPHHIFKRQNQRASKIKLNTLPIKTAQKTNLASQLAKLALTAKQNNKQSHQLIQNFMLINDSATIATEVPVYLTNWDAGYYKKQHNFTFPLTNYKTPITGHIDILQIRNNLIHILDYKPKSKNQNPINQLTLYALALSRKTNLLLKHFKCAWFDQRSYYEFYPLHAVYKIKRK